MVLKFGVQVFMHLPLLANQEKIYMNNRITMTDVTFLLIAKFDSIERIENAILVMDYLTRHYETKIVLWEVGSYQSHLIDNFLTDEITYSFHEDLDPILHRTAYLNEMVKQSATDFVAIWDLDIIIRPSQVFESVKLLRKGVDFVYPYKFEFLDTTKELRNIYYETRDLSILESYTDFMNSVYRPRPVGGAFFANRQSYLDSGLENEKFYGWGLEDGERIVRWKRQGRTIEHVDGCLFHLTHPRGANSDYNSSSENVYKKRVYLQTLRGNL